jgi:hypothetical protein
MTQRHVANIALRQQQQCSNEQRSRVVYPQKRKISAQSHRLSDSKLSFRFRPRNGPSQHSDLVSASRPASVGKGGIHYAKKRSFLAACVE